MNTTDTQMIRRTDVEMRLDRGMPYFYWRCPFCGTAETAMRDGEDECKACKAPLQLVKPRK